MGFAIVLNNILWADSALQGPEIFGPADANYCDVQGWWPVGTGNPNADPMFVPADTMFNITPTSPCIGRGIKSMQIGSVWHDSPAFDFDGQMRPRPTGTQRPDIGAQEERLTLPPPEGWFAQSSGTTNNLYEVSFVDVNNGFVVGASGTISRTTNAGATWTPQASGTTRAIWDGSFTTSTLGTVVREAGIILQTGDGGSSWKSQLSGTTHLLYSVAFPDANNGTAVGENGVILHTTTGGIVVGVRFAAAIVCDAHGLQHPRPAGCDASPGGTGGWIHEARFDARNLSSGVYLCRLLAGDFSQVRKLLLN